MITTQEVSSQSELYFLNAFTLYSPCFFWDYNWNPKRRALQKPRGARFIASIISAPILSCLTSSITLSALLTCIRQHTVLLFHWGFKWFIIIISLLFICCDFYIYVQFNDIIKSPSFINTLNFLREPKVLHAHPCYLFTFFQWGLLLFCEEICWLGCWSREAIRGSESLRFRHGNSM